MDGTTAAPVERSPFYEHLRKSGGIHRKNPELVRLAAATGFSVEHLFKVATGQRRCSTPFARAVAREARNKTLTVESFGLASQ